jgi:hypothetical protein
MSVLVDLALSGYWVCVSLLFNVETWGGGLIEHRSRCPMAQLNLLEYLNNFIARIGVTYDWRGKWITIVFPALSFYRETL